jgi:hypothetical protein
MSVTEPLPPLVFDIIKDRESVHKRYPLFQFKQYRVSKVPGQGSPSGWRQFLPIPRPNAPPPPDTPSATLYRIYEFLIADWTTQLRNELEYFCREHPSWSVEDIPDPTDPDPLRYAVLAVITKLMCEAFNRRVDLGLPRDAPAIIVDFEELARRPKRYEQPPSWVENVPPVEEMVFIPNAEGKLISAGDEEASEEFRKMNIVIEQPHIHFV